MTNFEIQMRWVSNELSVTQGFLACVILWGCSDKLLMYWKWCICESEMGLSENGLPGAWPHQQSPHRNHPNPQRDGRPQVDSSLRNGKGGVWDVLVLNWVPTCVVHH